MRLFIDTSTLFKKYVNEPGSELFELKLSKAGEIAVAPMTWVEMNAAIARRLRSRTLTGAQADWLRDQCRRDLVYFLKVLWNDDLEAEAEKLIYRFGLRTMDALQLASAHLSQADLFLTSDRALFEAAKKMPISAAFI